MSGVLQKTAHRARSWLRQRVPWPTGRPSLGAVDFGDLRRLEPVSRHFGYDRGSPVDRYYIENFLADCAADIRGAVLEIGDNTYTTRFGGARVESSDVLHVQEGNPQATYVGNLTDVPGIPDDRFDCLILTQTLHLIFDLRAALHTIHRVLKPGGVVLATAPGISHLSVDEWADYWCWSFTPSTLERLFAERFDASRVTVAQHGNVLAAVAFLEGLSQTELTREELDHRDPCYPLLITVRAVKPA